MSWDWLWLLAPTFVTAAAALVGMRWGVAATAKANRVERENKLNDERVAFGSALLAELKFLRDSYDYREKAMGRGDDYFDVPMLGATDVYDRLIDRIGLLTPEQGPAVVNAYHSAKHLIPNLRRLEKSTQEETAASVGQPAEGHVRLRPSTYEAARKLHRERIDLFDRVIKALGGT